MQQFVTQFQPFRFFVHIQDLQFHSLANRNILVDASDILVRKFGNMDQTVIFPDGDESPVSENVGYLSIYYLSLFIMLHLENLYLLYHNPRVLLRRNGKITGD